MANEDKPQSSTALEVVLEDIHNKHRAMCWQAAAILCFFAVAAILLVILMEACS